MSKQQSLRHAVRRGNAIIALDRVSNSLYEVWRKGSTRKQWDSASANMFQPMTTACFDENPNHVERKGGING